MKTLKNTLAAGVLAASVAAGALAASATPAAADVACNRYGECWRRQGTLHNLYRRLARDLPRRAWREHRRKGHYHWRTDRDDDLGYYAHGKWHSFEH